MTSPLLALFARSVREDTRGPATYWTRIALGGFIVLFMLATAMSRGWVGATGRNFFAGVVTLQMISISLIGLSYFASAITEEKEDATLGLLRMTNLSPLGILLGKSTSRLWSALLLLVAQFPFTIIAVTLGGISLAQIFAAYCTLGAYLFLLCNVALLGSVLARNTSRAAVFTVLTVGLFLAIGPLLRQTSRALPIYSTQTELDRIGVHLWAITPVGRLSEVLDTGFSGAPAEYQVASNIAIGVVCFFLAWLAFDRFCDRNAIETMASGPASRSWAGMRMARPPRPEADALVWKDFHFMHGGRAGRSARIVFYGGALVGTIAAWQTSNLATYNAWPSVIIAVTNFALAIDWAAMAARTFGSEIRDQTLSALAILPESIRQLARRKVRACLITAVPGLIYYVASSVITILQTRQAPGGEGMQLMVIVSTICGYVKLVFLAYVVAWFSLSMKRGALPVGYVVTYAFQMLISIAGFALLAGLSFIGATSSFGNSVANTMVSMSLTVGLGGIASLVVALLLHRIILRKLDGLAAEN